MHAYFTLGSYRVSTYSNIKDEDVKDQSINYHLCFVLVIIQELWQKRTETTQQFKFEFHRKVQYILTPNLGTSTFTDMMQTCYPNIEIPESELNDEDDYY